MKLKNLSVFAALARTLTLATCLVLPLSSCHSPTPITMFASSPPKKANLSDNSSAVVWRNRFEDANWKQRWGIRNSRDWGWKNTKVIKDPSGRFSQVLRVGYPAGSASPSVSRENKVPLGGAQFVADLGMTPKDSLRLSYYVRFSEDFNFVKGGKLPGLFGGEGSSGGDIPDGTDGFSTRFMWRQNGDGEVYAYLPTSVKDGTSIGRGSWRFIPGKWHYLEQEVVLNQPSLQNGKVRVWLDGNLVLEQDGLTYRKIDSLKIEGIFFSTFFGGGDPSWATPKNVYVDFANFSISKVK